MKNITTPKKHNPPRRNGSMLADEFSELVHGVSAEVLAEYFDVDPRTVRRWKSGEVEIPGAVARLTRMRYTDDAAALLGKEWAGYRFGSDGKLYVPGWRGGFDPHAIKALFFRTQLVGHLEAKQRAMEKRIAKLEQDVIEADIAAAKYRGLVSREAKFGLMLERIIA
jgi:hypothetical protein